MGLDTTHDCWHGAYSAFMRWRQMIAMKAGIPLPFMEGFFRDPPDWTTGLGSFWKEAALRDLSFLPVRWDSLKPDPLHALLNHSDCDGEIAWQDCAAIADRLEALLPELDGDGGGHIGSYREKTQTFIDGLRLAASRQENVEFH